MGQFRTYLDKFLDKQLIKTENQIRELKAVQGYSTSDVVIYTSNEVVSNSRSASHGGVTVHFFGAYYSFINNTPNKTVIPRIIPTTDKGLLTTCNIAGGTDNPNETLFLVKFYGTGEGAGGAFTVRAKVISNDNGILSIKQELTDYREFFEY